MNSPQWINIIDNICDDMRSKRENALDDLYLITGQKYDTVTENTLKILPILLEKLTSEGCKGKADILEFCFTVLHSEPETNVYFKAYHLIQLAIPGIVPLLINESEETSEAALLLLGTLRKEAYIIIDHVFMGMSEQSQSELLLNSLTLLIDLISNSELKISGEKQIQYVNIIRKFENQAVNMQIKSRLALLGFAIKDDKLPKLEQALEPIVDILSNNSKLIYRFLSMYPFEDRIQYLLDILKRIDKNPKSLAYCLEVLLINLFPTRWHNLSLLERIWHEKPMYMEYNVTNKPAFTNGLHNRQLSNIQKKSLQNLIEIENIWHIKTNLFELFGLPNTRAGIENLLE